jgi:hypothetical protein
MSLCPSSAQLRGAHSLYAVLREERLQAFLGGVSRPGGATLHGLPHGPPVGGEGGVNGPVDHACTGPHTPSEDCCIGMVAPRHELKLDFYDHKYNALELSMSLTLA